MVISDARVRVYGWRHAACRAVYVWSVVPMREGAKNPLLSALSVAMVDHGIEARTTLKIGFLAPSAAACGHGPNPACSAA